MNFKTFLSVCVIVISAGGVMAQQVAKATTNAPTPKLSVLTTSSSAGKGIPTDEEIKAFVTEYKETENSKDSLSLSVRCGVQKLSPEQRKKYDRSKKMPYQLLVDLVKVKEVNGKKMASRVTDGKCNIAILDEKGKIIKQSSENLIKLCAS